MKPELLAALGLTLSTSGPTNIDSSLKVQFSQYDGVHQEELFRLGTNDFILTARGMEIFHLTDEQWALVKSNYVNFNTGEYHLDYIVFLKPGTNK